MVAAASLKVALSLLTYAPGSLGGGDTYVERLFAELLTRDDVDVTAVVPRNATIWRDRRGAVVEEAFVAGAGGVPRMRSLLSLAVQRRKLSRRLAEVDVVHYPLTVPLPPAPRFVRTALTVHDVQHLDMPEWFSTAERAFRAVYYDRAARRASAILTISEFTKERLIAHLGIPRECVFVAPLGVDGGRFRPGPDQRESFLIYPARAWPHKNHQRLFAAFAQIRQRRPELRLIITGGEHGALGQLPRGVESLGKVPEARLVSLYQRAAAMVFPSLYEGFGLPPLEAMSTGCPVAASRRGALPEICGDAAVLFDPLDPEAIADGVERALDCAEELSGLGLAHAAQYTWRACADAHVLAYRSLLA